MELLFLALEVAMRHHPSRLPRLEAKASSSRFPKPESNSGTAHGSHFCGAPQIGAIQQH